MRRQKRWRVRVRRAIEDWIEVQCDTPQEAEELAAVRPGVISVFGKSAISGERGVDQVPLAGVLEDEDDA